MSAYVSMRLVWIWFLVDIPHHHDRDDDILLLHDEKARNELLDGVASQAARIHVMMKRS